MSGEKHGILVISHGSREQSWVKAVDAAVDAARQRWIEQAADEQESLERAAVPVYAAYLELVEGRLIQDGVDALQSEGVTHIYVMPLFVSGGSSHVEEIRQAFGFEPISSFIGDLEPLRLTASISFDEPIGAEAEVVQILQEQALALSSQADGEALLLLGHGSSMPYFYEKWEAGMRSIADELQQRIPFQQVVYAPLLPEGSRKALEQLLASGTQVLVIPIFISPGFFTRTVIPTRLADLSYNYSGETLLPHPLMSELLARRFGSYALK